MKNTCAGLSQNCTGCWLHEIVCSARKVERFDPSRSAILVEFMFPEPEMVFQCTHLNYPNDLVKLRRRL